MPRFYARRGCTSIARLVLGAAVFDTCNREPSTLACGPGDGVEGRVTDRWTRRRTIKVLGGAALATVASRVAGEAAAACVLTPRQTQGPYYFDPHLLRSDISEGSPGTPLRLIATIVAVPSCAPISNAVVHVWHADALGRYSGYSGEDTSGETFLRGAQPTATDGRAGFHTIYPGWYPGRTTHVHVKVDVAGRTAVTTQLYFPDTVTAAVYAGGGPYAARPTKDTRNEDDMVLRAVDASAVVADVAVEGGMRVARLTIGIASPRTS
jgi:protocatechuate 3,4-dioxygenase beta subunit